MTWKFSLVVCIYSVYICENRKYYTRHDCMFWRFIREKNASTINRRRPHSYLSVYQKYFPFSPTIAFRTRVNMTQFRLRHRAKTSNCITGRGRWLWEGGQGGLVSHWHNKMPTLLLMTAGVGSQVQCEPSALRANLLTWHGPGFR